MRLKMNRMGPTEYPTMSDLAFGGLKRAGLEVKFHLPKPALTVLFSAVFRTAV